MPRQSAVPTQGTHTQFPTPASATLAPWTPAALPAEGFVRERQVLAVLPFARSTWRKGIAEGRFPAPVHFGARCVMWRVQDIRALLAKLSAEGLPELSSAEQREQIAAQIAASKRAQVGGRHG